MDRYFLSVISGKPMITHRTVTRMTLLQLFQKRTCSVCTIVLTASLVIGNICAADAKENVKAYSSDSVSESDSKGIDSRANLQPNAAEKAVQQKSTAGLLYAAATGKIPGEIWEKTKGGGTVAVMVGQRLPPHLAAPTKENRAERRTAVDAVQSEILNKLEGSNYKLRRRMTTTPYLSLEADDTVLKTLDNSDLVLNVKEIGKFRPQ